MIDDYEVIDIKISSDGKTEWVSVELQQPTKLCTIFHKNHVLFRVAGSETTRPRQSAFSVLMDSARTIRKSGEAQ